MRRAVWTFGAWVVLCAAAVWGGEPTYTHKRVGFEITVSGSYSNATYFDGTIQAPCWISQTEGIAKAIVVVEYVEENRPLRSFFSDSWPWKWYRDKTTLTDIRMARLDGRRAIKVSLQDDRWDYVVYHAGDGRRGYTIVFQVDKSKSERAAKQIEAIVGAFKITEK